MQSFEYIAPRTVKEAVAALQAHRGALLLAGGTDALIGMKLRVQTPGVVVDIKRVRGLDELRFDEKSGLTIGAAVTMRQIELLPLVGERYAALAQAAAVVGSVQIRNLATLAGNVCNAAPSADTAPGLIVLGAKVRIAGPQGRRSMAVEKFMVGPGKTALKAGELVTGIQVPVPGRRTGSAYVRHTPRGAMDIAVVGVGAAVTLTPRTGACEDLKIVLGAVAPTPLRAKRAERLLKGEKFSEELIEAVAAAAAEEARPISDVRASAEFRRHMVRVLTKRMVAAARQDAQRQERAARRAA